MARIIFLQIDAAYQGRKIDFFLSGIPCQHLSAEPESWFDRSTLPPARFLKKTIRIEGLRLLQYPRYSKLVLLEI